jgi:DNA-binding MarR family transcriptional regulator
MGASKFTDADLYGALVIHGDNKYALANELGVSRNAVRKRLANIPGDVLASISHTVEEFRIKRADVFATIQKLGYQEVVRRLMDPEERKKLNLSYLNQLLGTVYDKERLETGQATEHIAHAHYQQLDDSQKAEVQLLRDKLTKQKLKAIQYED